MCEPKPGLRCANHLGNQRASLEKKIIDTELSIHQMNVAISEAASASDSSDAEAQVQLGRALGERAVAKHNLASAKRGYDSPVEDAEAGLERDIAYASAVGNVAASSARVGAIQDRLVDRRDEQREVLEHLKAEVAQVNREYDMTATGRKVLAQKAEEALLANNSKLHEVYATRLARAQESYDLTKSLAAGEKEGIALASLAAEQNPMLTYLSDRAVVSFNDSESLMKTRFSSGDLDSVRGDFIKNNQESHNVRALFGSTALLNDVYENGTYGVFHNAEGKLYLSKLVPSSDIDGGVKFANGRVSTGLDPTDQSNVMVEKGANGKVGMVVRSAGGRNSFSDAANKVGIVSHHILSKIPKEHLKEAHRLLNSFKSELALAKETNLSEEVVVRRFKGAASSPAFQASKAVLAEAINNALHSPSIEHNNKYGKMF